MGAELSALALKGRLADQLLDLMGRLGARIRMDTTQEIVKTISELSAWFSLVGCVNIADWEQVRADLRIAQRKQGPRTFPLTIFSLWGLIRDTLLNDDVIIKKTAKSFKQNP